MCISILLAGTLDGFSFDSEEDIDRVAKTSARINDQKDENGDNTETKTKVKKKKEFIETCKIEVSHTFSIIEELQHKDFAT